ncbi:hypothetical protein E5K00_16170 [Hymenobacter aquaticus]|uniref:Endonuclease GajA/Old nuclease/RecF-like AAA domain-containing protein n=1 Tax=Hymenobacter aquaticus TaxID=1867101 RepID=A0A4Z0PXZ8_9BACT|nr:AAA family ATPase [Hymenobacter aquaticus]TGE21801.1 hypothetical protein E5K00_16170 [Hymenobacter aquaticus]
MNEQLIVKNFGPIKDATVDFKKVTVFIGPTGGGKSTLAKLAAILKDPEFYSASEGKEFEFFANYSIKTYFQTNTHITWENNNDSILIMNDKIGVSESLKNKIDSITEDTNDALIKNLVHRLQNIVTEQNINLEIKEDIDFLKNELDKLITENIFAPIYKAGIAPYRPSYIPSERSFVPAIEYSWAGLMRDDIGLPKQILNFANSFSTSRKYVPELNIDFFDVKYLHINGQDYIKIPEREEPLRLFETASGIQSVTPLLVLLTHLLQDSDQTQSFIIEEPELNLYPTAQRDLVYTLLEKCTQGNNALTITTHSPYVLAALNLCLYAHKIKELFPHQARKVNKLIPEKYWVSPREFSAYYVAGGGVKSIFDDKTGLLSESQLDEVSGEFADIFDRLTDLRVPEKKTLAKAKSAKK